MDPRIRASWYVNYLYLCQQQAPVYMSDQINSNKFHTINSTMSFQHEEKWKFIKQVTGYPATQTIVDKQQLIPIYRLFIHYIQDDVSESKSVTVPARQLIWADFDDLQVLWAVLAVPAWAALLLTCFWTWFWNTAVCLPAFLMHPTWFSHNIQSCKFLSRPIKADMS